MDGNYGTLTTDCTRYFLLQPIVIIIIIVIITIIIIIIIIIIKSFLGYH